MMLVHILTQGFTTPNGSAFLFPILYHRAALRAAGLRYRMFRQEKPGLGDCDVMIVDSKFFRTWWSHGSSQILDRLASYREKAGRLLWFDTTDSTGTLQTAVLPLVDRYYKGQLLKDRSLYQKPLYGARAHTDYYHREYGVIDDEPVHSNPICSQDELAKLGVSWNSALADYSLRGRLKISLYRRLRWRGILRPSTRWVHPAVDRKIETSARFGASYGKATVRYQRERIREMLRGTVDTARIPRKAYYRELEQSKIVVSPFGWGELAYRDFEAFLSGCILIKPSMGHLETWPDLYQDSATFLSHSWSMEGLVGLVELVSRDYGDYVSIAAHGQSYYRDCLEGHGARESFVARFANIITTPHDKRVGV